MKSRNIFINYRRQDTSGEAGRLADFLKEHFEDDQVFMDIENIDPGTDFRDAINIGLSTCAVVLVLIGPNWLNVKGPQGKRRLDDPDDFIRLEIKAALLRNIRVIPVLVDGASLPLAEELPDEISNLVKKQAYEISNKRWKFDTSQLIIKIREIVGTPGPNKNFNLFGSKKAILFIGLAATIVICFIIYRIVIQESPPIDRIEALKNRAGKVNQIVVHNRYNDLVPMMNTGTQLFITRELVNNVNDSINKILGAFVNPIDTIYNRAAEKESFMVRNQYQNGIATTFIIFDQDEKVFEIWVNPHPNRSP